MTLNVQKGVISLLSWRMVFLQIEKPSIKGLELFKPQMWS